MPKPWVPQQPITSVQEPATCVVRSEAQVAPGGRVSLRLTTQATAGAVHTTQDGMTASISAFWEGLLNDVHVPSEQAERDKIGTLSELKLETCAAGCRQKFFRG